MVQRVIFTCVLGLLLPACRTTNEPTTPSTSTVISFTDLARMSSWVALEDKLVVQLPAPTSPELAWQVAGHDWRFLKPLTPPEPAPPPTAEWTATFLPLRTGITRLHFILIPRLQERQLEITDRRELILTIQ